MIITEQWCRELLSGRKLGPVTAMIIKSHMQGAWAPGHTCGQLVLLEPDYYLNWPVCKKNNIFTWLSGSSEGNTSDYFSEIRWW